MLLLIAETTQGVIIAKGFDGNYRIQFPHTGVTQNASAYQDLAMSNNNIFAE